MFYTAEKNCLVIPFLCSQKNEKTKGVFFSGGMKMEYYFEMV